MLLTVIGSTGRTGRLVVAEALRRGHQVTAFTRRPAELATTRGLAAVVAGDGRDPAAVRRALAGADAVVAIVSADSRRGPHHAAAVARCLTRVMADAGVPRLVATGAYPTVARRPRLPLALLRLVLADAYADVAEMERVLAASTLEWTVVRLNRLTDGPARGRIELDPDLLDRPRSLSRADAAAALVDLAESGEHARTALNAAGAPAPRSRSRPPSTQEQHT